MTVLPALPPLDDLETLNVHLETLSAENRVCWALQHAPDHPALSSSFGAQSAVMLHLLTGLHRISRSFWSTPAIFSQKPTVSPTR